jgi:formylglycine-generating enzyme required for sulfatase activity
VGVQPFGRDREQRLLEARDDYTGLVWQRAYSDTQLTWSEAQGYCETLGLNGHTWRLPSVRELTTLVDEALVGPAIDRETFPDTKFGSRSNDWYWASHQQRGNANAAWAINYDDGFTGTNSGEEGDWNYFTAAWARCVR